MQKSEVKGGFSNPPALVLIISLLMVVMMFLNLGSIDSQNTAYAVMLLLHLIIFGLPAAFYCVLRGRGFLGKISLKKLSPSCFGLIALGTLMLCLQSCILKFGVFYFGYDYSAYTLYGSSFQVGTDSALGWLLMVVSLAVVPAVTEEIVFRGIVFTEYRKSGFICAALATSLLFAFVHFDLAQFVIYFLDGMLLAWLVYLTGSVLSSILAHVLYNLFTLFLEKYIWLFSSNPDSEILFWLILIALYLLLAFFFVGSAEKLLRKRGESGDEPFASPARGTLGGIYLSVFTSKPMLAELFVFIVIALIDTFAN